MQPQSIELNGKALKAEADKSHEFRALAYYGANRDRNREVTDIEQMRKGIELRHNEKLDPARWIEAFKKLEDMGYGALIMGRRGNPNRFRWNYSLKAIGTAAMSGTPLMAPRIMPRMKGERVVNDYYGVRPSSPAAASKKAAKMKSANKVEEKRSARPMPAPKPSIQRRELQSSDADVTHQIYIVLRADYTFEASIPTLTSKEADVLCNAIKRCVG